MLQGDTEVLQAEWRDLQAKKRRVLEDFQDGERLMESAILLGIAKGA